MTFLFMSWPGFRGHQGKTRLGELRSGRPIRVHLVHQGNGS